MVIPALIPCPFCKSTCVRLQGWYSDGTTDVFWYSVVCDNIDCRAEGPQNTDKDIAIKNWNERAILEGGS